MHGLASGSYLTRPPAVENSAKCSALGRQKRLGVAIFGLTISGGVERIGYQYWLVLEIKSCSMYVVIYRNGDMSYLSLDLNGIAT